ncbi:MAG: FimV/HubP family polar landmark protein [Woeseiaceae bacterium]
MSLRLARLWLLLGLFLAGEVLALGLGDIELDSALNEPLRAEIRLVSATAEDLAGLKVSLASAETFERYGLHRPLYLTRLTFAVEPSGRADGNVIRVSSQEPITEPFVTFLVEATWPRGRLLREYTVLLDPPTFAPPPASGSSEAVTAPSRAAPADSGRIERPSPAALEPQLQPATQAPDATAPFDARQGGTVEVQRGDTLWGIAERMRPDSRLTMNQTMVAIYEANPEAFADNINRLTAGATLRIPGADEIFNISRNDATSQVAQQNAAYGLVDGSGRTEPRLTLVPPDGEQEDYRGGAAGAGTQPDPAAVAAAEQRIRELEDTVEEQQSLIEVRNDELAQLREELARVRGEAAAEPPAAETPATEPAPGAETVDESEDTEQVFADDTTETAEEEVAADDDTAPGEQAEPPATTTERPARVVPDEPGLVDRAISALTGFWGILGIVLLVVIGLLIWLAKRATGRGDEESTGVWDALDGDDDADSESRASTERLRALARDDERSIVVVEQESSPERRARGRAAPAPLAAVDLDLDDFETAADTSLQPTLEDTFSSETAINLDQSDPVAEADFHMAYGLYDQAADLINGALAIEPERQDLMAKLCEIYFVWGNRDAFVDAAGRLHDQLGGEATPDWDKIVIMGRQIAGDHRLFAGASAAGATRAVDLTLDDEGGAGALDMDFAGGPDGEVSEVVDLAADDGPADRSGLDFIFDEELDTGASTTREMPGRHGDEPTVESPTLESRAGTDSTVEARTIEQPFDNVESTSELPTLAHAGDDAMRAGDATAEIDLDDLGLDLDDLAAAGLRGDLDDDDFAELDETTESGVLGANDDLDATGRNVGLDDDDMETVTTGIHEGFDLDALSETGEMPAADEATGKNPALDDLDDDIRTDVDFDLDSSLLDATGLTQVLSDNDKTLLAPAFDDDAETLLASFDDEDEYEATAALSPQDVDAEFDFAKTEALPKDAFSRDSSSDETGEMPALTGVTDVDLDLDDLTAALRFSDGDTVDQPRDDATVERPRVKRGEFVDLDLGDLGEPEDDAPTQALASEDFEDDLHDARTMTEVGTKLDLARAYVDMGDPEGARSILDEVLDEGDEGQRQQAQKLIDSLPS